MTLIKISEEKSRGLGHVFLVFLSVTLLGIIARHANKVKLHPAAPEA
jgi:hypothetical protein